MAAPTYEWVCHQCGEPNRAHVEACAGCGKSAYYKPGDLPPPTRSQQGSEDFGETPAFYLLEVIPAIVLALYGPYWALGKLAHGETWPAVGLLLGESLCAVLFLRLLSHGVKLAAYISMFVFLMIAEMVGVWPW